MEKSFTDKDTATLILLIEKYMVSIAMMDEERVMVERGLEGTSDKVSADGYVAEWANTCGKRFFTTLF